MFGTFNKPAFTLLELLLVVLIMGILISIALPALKNRQPYQEREQFLSQFNTLMSVAWRNAITTGKASKVVFTFNPKGDGSIVVEELTNQKDRDGNPISRPVKLANAHMRLPLRYQIKNFFVERFDEAKRFVGRPTGQTWFFIMPNGLAQEVIINLVDSRDKVGGKGRPVGLVLNPFTAQFKIYNEFQK